MCAETTAEKTEGDIEKSKDIETEVNQQLDELHAENNASQTGLHILGGFKEKTAQKVCGKYYIINLLSSI